MDDPYRTSQQTGTCPRCQNSTESDSLLQRLACVRGCGEWYPKDMLAEVIAWNEVEGKGKLAGDAWPWGAALCPICQDPMSVGYRDELRYDYCSRHGVWLDAGEYERPGPATSRCSESRGIDARDEDRDDHQRRHRRDRRANGARRDAAV